MRRLLTATILHAWACSAALAQQPKEAAADRPITLDELRKLNADRPATPAPPAKRTPENVAEWRKAYEAYRRRLREFVRGIAPGLVGRRPANPVVAEQVAALLANGGETRAATPFYLAAVRGIEGPLAPPPARLARGETAEVRRARRAQGDLLGALKGATTAAQIREVLAEGRRLFADAPWLNFAYRNYETLSRIHMAGTPAEELEALVDEMAAAVVPAERETFVSVGKMLGREAPPPNADHVVGGTEEQVRDLRGKVVLLDFFAFWCGPCKATFPHLKSLAARHGKALRIVGVTYLNGYFRESKVGVTDDPRGEGRQLEPAKELEYLERFRKAYGLTWPFAVDGELYRQGREVVANTRKSFPAYGVRGIPHAALLDHLGRLRYVKVGSGESPDFDAAIERLVREARGG